MNQLPILIRREFWEHRNTFVMLPAIGAMFFMAMTVLFVAGVDVGGLEVHMSMDDGDSVKEWAISEDDVNQDDIVEMVLARLDELSPEQRESKIYPFVHGISLPFSVTLWVVVFFYLMGALYEDRKDRSILFWKSMPVSDAMTVGSKLITALLLVPLVYFVCIAAVQLTALLVVSLASIGHEGSVWDLILAPSNLFVEWIHWLVFMLLQAIWALPFYGWLLLVSARSKSVPLVWVVAIPLVIVIVEQIFTNSNILASWIVAHSKPGYFVNSAFWFDDMVARMGSIDTVVSLLVGATLIYGAILFRGKADEI